MFPLFRISVAIADLFASYGDFIKTAAILTGSENDKSLEVESLCFSLTLLKVQKSVHLFLFTMNKTLNSPEG